MKYLIFSDSHRNTAPMDEVIQKEECDAVLHLGDVADDVEHLRRKFFYKTAETTTFFSEKTRPKSFLKTAVIE